MAPLGGLGEAFGSVFGASKSSMRPRVPPRGAKRTPRVPKTKAARIAQEAPKGCQKSSRRPPEESKILLRKLQHEVGSKNNEKLKK